MNMQSVINQLVPNGIIQYTVKKTLHFGVKERRKKERARVWVCADGEREKEWERERWTEREVLSGIKSQNEKENEFACVLMCVCLRTHYLRHTMCMCVYASVCLCACMYVCACTCECVSLLCVGAQCFWCVSVCVDFFWQRVLVGSFYFVLNICLL